MCCLVSGLFADKVSSLGIEIVVVMVGSILIPSGVGQQDAVLQVEEIRKEEEEFQVSTLSIYISEQRFALRHYIRMVHTDRLTRQAPKGLFVSMTKTLVSAV